MSCRHEALSSVIPSTYVKAWACQLASERRALEEEPDTPLAQSERAWVLQDTGTAFELSLSAAAALLFTSWCSSPRHESFHLPSLSILVRVVGLCFVPRVDRVSLGHTLTMLCSLALTRAPSE